MSAVELRYIGRTTREAFISRVKSILLRWSADWSASNTEFDIFEVECASPDMAMRQWVRMTANRGMLTLGFVDGMYERLGSLLANTDRADSSGLSAKIGNRAISALCAEILGVETEAVISNAFAELDPYRFDTRYGNTTISLTAGNVEFYIIIHPQLVDSYYPRKQSGSSRLHNPLPAAAEVDVPMRVMMDFGDIPISTMVDLKIGSVLVSNVSIDSNFILESVHDGKKLAHASLHRNSSLRSIKLIENENSNVK